MSAHSSSDSPFHSKSGTAYTKLPVRRFAVPTGKHGDTIDIKIAEPQLRAEGLGLETWASSFILASLLYKLQISFESGTSCEADKRLPYSKIPVLELGAGTGLVGLSAQAIWGAPVILTDLEPIVPGLQMNIDLNSETSDASEEQSGRATEGHCITRCGTLDWKSPSTIRLSQGETLLSTTSKAHVILAADTVYSEEHPELLADVVKNWLAPGPDARVVIAYPMRVAYLDEIRNLWSRFEEIGLEAAQEGRETAQESMFDDELLIEWSVWKWKADQCIRS
ncbi:hypothetical protein ABW21_db0202615 [Orbilia brochopaga]|nr:hypothetical protein ABW21_db0202615 [Drechslerella brochopaga]